MMKTPQIIMIGFDNHSIGDVSFDRPDVKIIEYQSTLREVFSSVEKTFLHANAFVFDIDGDKWDEDLTLWTKLHLACPEAQIIGVTEGENTQRIASALAMRFDGLLSKRTPTNDFWKYVFSIAAGEKYHDPVLVARTLYLPDAQKESNALGPIAINADTQTLSVNGVVMNLSQLEIRIYLFLERHAGQVVSYDVLLEKIWGAPTKMGGTYNQVRCCVRRLRKKLKEYGVNQISINTAHGQGYMLEIHQVS
jgi:DNA-binding response OmpR family regulator